uniref:Aquaporin 1a (Colton blood group), tandem duplicate 2 n=1 Tax=Neogobius melanostomus TaxID=47308 RepID=A0A8C6WLR7_9GOBI
MRELKSWPFWRAVAAEFIGMLLFIVFGIASAIGSPGNAAQEVKVSLAFGLAIATLVQTLGHVSGAHLNPAVSIGLLVSCQISLFRFLCYTVAQMLGAVAASAGKNSRNGINMIKNKLTGVSAGQGFAIEFFATLQLVLCVIAVTDKRRTDVQGSAPLAIGLSVTLGHLVAISYTGCGINPARSFGPAIIRSQMANHWVYWLGPMCGGITAAFIYDLILAPRSPSLSARRDILLNGPVEDTNDNLIRDGGSPGPSQWPKQ